MTLAGEKKQLIQATELHKSSLVIDLHVDSFLLNAQFGYDFLKKHQPYFPGGAFFGHADLPRMQEGSVNVAGFGVVINPLKRDKNAWKKTRSIIQSFHQTCNRSKGRLTGVNTSEEITLAVGQGQTCGFLGLEGAHTLGGNLDNLAEVRDLGVRYITLTHFSSNKAASCARGWRSRADQGLTDWGRELISRMNAKGIVVDVAHVNKSGFIEAVQLSSKPCWISHGTVASVHEHWRATDDECLTQLFEKGGMIGIMFAPQFLCSKLRADSSVVFRHIDDIVTRFGDDFVGLGSDFDGYIAATPRDLRDISQMTSITHRMVEAGYSEKRIRKILGLNALRVLRDNE